MANLLERAGGYLALIREATQPPRDYFGGLGNRIIGRQAWREAKQRPLERESSACDKLPAQPAWARKINEVVAARSAEIHGAVEFLVPVTSRFWVPMTRNPENFERYNLNRTNSILFASMAVDMALLLPLLLSRNVQDFVTIKLAINAATQVGLDIAEAKVNKK